MTDRQEPPTLGEFNGHEIYPMPMFATLTVADVAAVTRWYQDALGFSVVFAAPSVGGQPALVHLRRRKYQDLLVVPARLAPALSAPSSVTITFALDDPDALARQAQAVPALGASVIAGPVDTPWNTRDLRITDPAGHLLIFTGRQANPDPEQARRMQAMFDAAKRKD